jgi:DNA-binding LacI/PurR family transcriptional regulator
MASRVIRRSLRGRVTMRDVARLANVSQSTVSRVLNEGSGDIPISRTTRQRVLDAVQQLGYHPNLHAGSLRGQKTRMLAMMIADIANPFYHPMVRAAQDVARSYTYDVMVANTDHRHDEEIHFCESTIRRPVDGILMVPYHLTAADIDRLIVRTGVAMAAVGQHVCHPQVDVVFGDDSLGTFRAVTWLIEARQHTRIGFIGVTEGNSAGARRRQAFLDATRQAGLEQPPEYFQIGDWSPESGRAAMCQLLSLSTPPTAVFACNDLMAIGAIEAAKQLGLRVPGDVAVVGFDDIPAASWVCPRLTTVAQHPSEMGTLLAEALFQRIRGDYSGPGRRIEVPCDFVERESA